MISVPGQRELPPRGCLGRRGAKLRKLFPQKWMIPRDLGGRGGNLRDWGREHQGAQGRQAGSGTTCCKAAKKANRASEAPWRPQEYRRWVSWPREKEWGLGDGGTASAGDQGWEGAVQERTRESALITRSSEESRMKLLGLSEEGDRGAQLRSSPQFDF